MQEEIHTYKLAVRTQLNKACENILQMEQNPAKVRWCLHYKGGWLPYSTHPIHQGRSRKAPGDIRKINQIE